MSSRPSSSGNLSTSTDDMIELKQNFVNNGYAKIEHFCPPEVVQQLKTKARQLVDSFDLARHPVSVFTADDSNVRVADDYFMTSADKVRYFLERDAYDPIGRRLTLPKDQCLNKIGHALHTLVPEFTRLTFNDDVKTVARTLGLVDPVVVQSMVIFKNARVGGEVSAHQDSTYLHCLPSPIGTVLGFWIPLDDATLENGCLQFAAGSHKRRMTPATRWTRTTDPESGGDRIRMAFTKPDADFSDETLIPVPANSGDCLLIDGLTVHASEPNKSDNARWVYTFHCYDRAKGDWDPANWLQPTERGAFASLYDYKF